MQKTDSFPAVSPFLIEKAMTASVGSMKTICKMRSVDLFLEVSSAKQASALRNLRELAHFDVTSVSIFNEVLGVLGRNVRLPLESHMLQKSKTLSNLPPHKLTRIYINPVLLHRRRQKLKSQCKSSS
ncbi:hypothetical protein NPIL_214761 [Nephila pilipes]|uniref:Uncharacterized protein n=1 Tax=Nephila pilipes TaxID=299642 RepID=A0A8X6N9F8_NEPPI|nr:hypothetical protein NPIL_214761 [Nephila pilipes]